MLNSYPVTINGDVIPYPDTWEETPKKLTNTFETESGHVRKIVVRGSRLSVTCTFTVSSRWLRKFMEYRDADSLTVGIYEPRSEVMGTYTMFIDDETFRYERIPESRYAQNTNGLYRLQFDMEAF